MRLLVLIRYVVVQTFCVQRMPRHCVNLLTDATQVEKCTALPSGCRGSSFESKTQEVKKDQESCAVGNIILFAITL